jgi:predicted amidohydrolase
VELSMTCLLDMLSCGLKHFSLFYSVVMYTEIRIKAMLNAG